VNICSTSAAQPSAARSLCLPGPLLLAVLRGKALLYMRLGPQRSVALPGLTNTGLSQLQCYPDLYPCQHPPGATKQFQGGKNNTSFACEKISKEKQSFHEDMPVPTTREKLSHATRDSSEQNLSMPALIIRLLLEHELNFSPVARQEVS